MLPLSTGEKPARFELRVAFLYIVAFIAMGIHLPFFPLWLEYLRFDAEAIGIILAIPLFVRVVATPLVTAIGDRAKDRASVLVAASAGAFVISLGYFLPPTYGVVLLVSVLLAGVWAAHVPLIDSLAVSGVRRYGSGYTQMRIWGSVSFLVVNLAGGLLLSRSGPAVIPWILACSLGAMLLATALAPRIGPPRRQTSTPETRNAALRNRGFLLLTAGCGIIAGSHGFLYAFSSIYWKSLGISDGIIGLFWAWGVLAEVVMFALFPRIMGGMSARAVIVTGGLIAIARWALFPLVWPLGGGVLGFFLLQSLHAFSTGLMLIGVQKVIAEMVPEHQSGSAQGIAFFANGAAMAIATIASGWLYERVGGNGFYAMTVVAALGTSLTLLAQPQRSGVGGETMEPS